MKNFRLTGLLVLLCLDICAISAEPPAIRLAKPGTVLLGVGDTLEFTLHAEPDNTANQSIPDVSVRLIPQINPHVKTVVLPSTKANEWLVHVRGLDPDKFPNSATRLDLQVRWRFGNQPEHEILLNEGLAFKAEAADVVLLMDGSISMQVNDPERLRVAAARDFIASARRSGAIGRIGIVQFDNTSRVIIGLTPVNDDFEKALAQIDERGQTDIDGGIRTALSLITGVKYETPNDAPDLSAVSNKSVAPNGCIILLTDGEQEPGVYGNAHNLARKAGVPVHTLALGREADRKLLQRVADETGGTFADAAKDRDLARAYSSIASRISSSRTVLNFEVSNATDNISQMFPVDGACRSIEASITSARPGQLSILAPNQKTWDSPTLDNPKFIAQLPEPGQWKATWKSNGNAIAQDKFGALAVTARTALYPLFFRAEPVPDAPVEIDGENPSVALSLFEVSDALQGATVNAMLQFEHVQVPVQLFDDGLHSDNLPGDGVYAGILPPPPVELSRDGAYPIGLRGVIRAVVTGNRAGPQEFRRETVANFIIVKSSGPALIAPNAVDLGSHYAGEIVHGAVPLRVRGLGGSFSVASHSPSNLAQDDLSSALRFLTHPSELKLHERTELHFDVTLLESLKPGRHGGVLELKLGETEAVYVPWHIQVLNDRLDAPASIDLGQVYPGHQSIAKLRLRATGPPIELRPLEYSDNSLDELFSRPAVELTQPSTLFVARNEASELALSFSVAKDCTPGKIEGELLLRDIQFKERARIKVYCEVLPDYLDIQNELTFGNIEPGESLSRTLKWRWANRPELPTDLHAKPINVISPTPKFAFPVPINGWATANATLSVPVDSKSGEIGGWLTLEAGPVLSLLHWSANVIEPRLAIDPRAIDFGTLSPGKKLAKQITLHADGAHALPLILESGPFSNPHSNTTLESALSISEQRLELAPGETRIITLQVNVPNDPSEGQYETAVQISTRLGNIAVPVHVKITSDIATAAYHIAPSGILLSMADRAHLPLESIQIFSHRDEPLSLSLSVALPGKSESSSLPARLLAERGGHPLEQMNLTLPARGTVGVLVQAVSSALDGDTCQIHVVGAGEHQIVEVTVERLYPPDSFSSGAPPPPTLLNWMLLLFSMLIVLLGVFIHFQTKRRWVRFAFYSVLVHLAFLPWAMPSHVLMSALPSSVEITLLESQQSMGLEMSGEQQRRLEALKSGGGDSIAGLGHETQPAAPAQAPKLADAKGNANLPVPAATAGEAVPSASNLESAHGDAVKDPGANTERKTSETKRMAQAPETDDSPLAADSLVPAAPPGSKAAAPSADTTPHLAAGPLMREANSQALASFAPPIQAAPAATAQPDGDLPLAAGIVPAEAFSSTSKSTESVRTGTAGPVNGDDDAPLAASALSPSAVAPPATTQKQDAIPGGDSPQRNAPIQAGGVGTYTTANYSPPTSVSVPMTTVPELPQHGESPLASISTGGFGSDGKQFTAAGGKASLVEHSIAVLSAPSDESDAPLDSGGTALGRATETQKGLPGLARGAGNESGLGIGSGKGDNPAARGGSTLSLGGGDWRTGFAHGSDKGAGLTPGIASLAGTGSGKGNGQSGLGGRGNGGVGAGESTFTAGLTNGTGGYIHGLGSGSGGHTTAGVSGDGDSPLASGEPGKSITGGGPGGHGKSPFGTPDGTGKNGSANGGRDTPAGSTGLAGSHGFGRGGSGTVTLAGGLPGGSGTGAGGNALTSAGPVMDGLGASGISAGIEGAGGSGNTFARSGLRSGHGRAPIGNGDGDGDAPLTSGIPGGNGTAPGGAINGGKLNGDPSGGPGGTGPFRLGAADGKNLRGGAGGDGSAKIAALSGIGVGRGGPGGGGGTGLSPRGSDLNSHISSNQFDSDAQSRVHALRNTHQDGSHIAAGEYTGALLRVNLGLARHSADWNSSPTALHFLRTAFLERAGLPELEVNVKTVDLFDLNGMKQCQTIMITANYPIVFKPEELKAMREYIQGGGVLWVNDSTDTLDNKFDIPFRLDVPNILPGAKLVKLPLEHPFFTSCYDLRKGYKGFRVPPGDKYRVDYIEAVLLPLPPNARPDDFPRAGLIYTRNDYSDGLEIDPRMNAGMKSLTDLTNDEMLEGSLRFGMNLVCYGLQGDAPKVPPPPESSAEVEKIYRYSGPPLPELDNYSTESDPKTAHWKAEKEWCNETTLKASGKLLETTFTGGAKYKAAISRDFKDQKDGKLDLGGVRALVLDINSGLERGFNVALLFNTKDGKAYETRPIFVKPGWNRNLRFPLDKGDMKSSLGANPWKEYDTAFDPRTNIERITVMLYNLNDSGHASIGPIHEQRK